MFLLPLMLSWRKTCAIRNEIWPILIWTNICMNQFLFQSLTAKRKMMAFFLVPLLDTKIRKSYLYILDAKTMNVMNRAKLPTIVPYSFHGSFFPGYSLDNMQRHGHRIQSESYKYRESFLLTRELFFEQERVRKIREHKMPLRLFIHLFIYTH